MFVLLPTMASGAHCHWFHFLIVDSIYLLKKQRAQMPATSLLLLMHGISAGLEPPGSSLGVQSFLFYPRHRHHHFYPSRNLILSTIRQRLSVCGIYSIAWNFSFPFLRYLPRLRPFCSTNKITFHVRIRLQYEQSE